MRSGFLLLLAALILVPGAEAAVCQEWWQAEASPTEAVFEIGIRYSGADAADDRRNIDLEVGDGDGIVEKAEVRAFEEKWSWVGTDLAPACSALFGFFRIDGSTPSAMVRVEKHMIDAAGVPREDPHWYRMRLVMAYAGTGTSANVSAAVPPSDAFRAAFGCASNMHTDWWGDHTCGQRPDDGVGGPRQYAFLPLDGNMIVLESVDPAGFREFWDGHGLVANDVDEFDEFRATSVSFQVTQAPNGMAGGVAWGILGLGLAVFGMAWWIWTRTRIRAFASLYAFFSRIDRDKAADHPRRQAVLAAIESSPGIAFNELGRVTEIPKGALAHHVRTLVRSRLVVSRHEGVWTRFYRVGSTIPRPRVTTRQDTILDVLAREPGLAASELARRLGLERRAAQYHLDRMVAAGVLRVERDAAPRRYFPLD